MPRYYKVFVAVIVVILLLWFLLGFIVPFAVFKDLDLSGKFGDSFGSVNTLFSGLAFLGLTYTIIQQIEIFKEQKAQEKVSFYLTLISEAKDDLNSLESGGLKGLAFINQFNVMILDTTKVRARQLDHYFRFFTNVCTQFNYIISALKKEKLIDDEEKHLIKTKIILIYYTYFFAIHDKIKNIDYYGEEGYFRVLKDSVEHFNRSVGKLMKETT